MKKVAQTIFTSLTKDSISLRTYTNRTAPSVSAEKANHVDRITRLAFKKHKAATKTP